MRREGAERDPGKLDIVQDPPGGVAAIEVEHMCVPVLSLAFDGVIVREKRVNFKSSVLIKGNGLSISGEDMKVEGLDGVTGVVVQVRDELVQEKTRDPLFPVCLAHAK